MQWGYMRKNRMSLTYLRYGKICGMMVFTYKLWDITPIWHHLAGRAVWDINHIFVTCWVTEEATI